jgi:hypothetical protein
MRVPTLEILGLPLGGFKTKCHLDVGFVAKHRIYYKGAEVTPYSENVFHQGMTVHKTQPQHILKMKIPPLNN